MTDAKLLENMNKHTNILLAHSTILNNHTAILVKHTDELAKHTLLLDYHTKVLDQHTEILNKHSKVLDQHTYTLNEHSKVLDQHTAALNRLEHLLTNNSEKLSQIISELHRQHRRQEEFDEKTKYYPMVVDNSDKMVKELKDHRDERVIINKNIRLHEERLVVVESALGITPPNQAVF